MTDRIKALEDALEWYAEQARLCRLIHSEGDAGRQSLSDDGGKRARAALAASQPATGCHQPDLVTAQPALDVQPLTVQDAARVVADAINNDMQTFNKALASIPARPEMPVQHFFSMALKAYAEELHSLKE